MSGITSVQSVSNLKETVDRLKSSDTSGVQRKRSRDSSVTVPVSSAFIEIRIGDIEKRLK